MDIICRLCLLSGPEKMKEFVEGSDILLKIQSLLSVKITCNDYLPSNICTTCFNKVEEIEEFLKTVTDNQKKLQNILCDGVEGLKKFYSKHSLKEESKTDDLLVNNKENEVNYIHSDVSMCKVRSDSDTQMKTENNFDEPFQYSSDDEVALSLVKKDNKKKKKVKTKLSPIEKTSEADTESRFKNEDIDTKSSILLNNLNHKCLTCSDVFISQNDLLKHYRKEHSNEKDKDLMNSYSILQENDIQKYKCHKCDRVFENLRAVKRHLEAHVKNRPFVCKECGRTYRTVSEIIRHGRAHNGIKLNCSYECGYSTVYLGALKEHEKRHRTEFKYKCEKCGKGFQVKTWYEEHQNVHKGVKPFVCNLCGIAFHMSRYLTSHRSTVHPQSSDLKRYICVHCSLPCDSRKALTIHLKEHGIVRCFLCDICGKTLSSKQQLKFHKRVHLGEKPFSCSICNKSFTKKCNLKLHELTHTDERTHKCLKCGKMYKQRSTLLKHSQKYCRGT